MGSHAQGQNATTFPDRISFLWKQHDYISEYVKFADAKAAFVATFATGLLGALLGKESPSSKLLPLNLLQPHGMSEWLSTAALFCLSTTVLLSLLVVIPRIDVKSGRPRPMSWIEIARYPDANAFAEKALGTSEDDASALLACQIFFMSLICARKNNLVRYAMFCLGISAILVVMCVVKVQ